MYSFINFKIWNYYKKFKKKFKFKILIKINLY